MKMKLFVKYISLLILLFVVGGCKEKMADMYVTKVTDLTGEEEQVLKLEYDRDGKIIKYGDTPVRYEPSPAAQEIQSGGVSDPRYDACHHG